MDEERGRSSEAGKCSAADGGSNARLYFVCIDYILHAFISFPCDGLLVSHFCCAGHCFVAFSIRSCHSISVFAPEPIRLTSVVRTICINADERDFKNLFF